MNLYDVVGMLSAFFLCVSSFGIWIQLRTIWKRKLDFGRERTITSVLSLNHFTVRFVTFFSIMVLGISQHPFNHYLVWPYLPPVLLLLLIIREIYTDRRDRTSGVVFFLCLTLFVAGLVVWWFGLSEQLHATTFAETVILCASVLIAQSDLHQVWLIRRSGNTGAVAIRTHQTTVIKDASAVLFGLVMGIAVGWPLVASAGTSFITKSLILYHFRWAGSSSLAAERREQNSSQSG